MKREVTLAVQRNRHSREPRYSRPVQTSYQEELLLYLELNFPTRDQFFHDYSKRTEVGIELGVSGRAKLSPEAFKTNHFLIEKTCRENIIIPPVDVL